MHILGKTKCGKLKINELGIHPRNKKKNSKINMMKVGENTNSSKINKKKTNTKKRESTMPMVCSWKMNEIDKLLMGLIKREKKTHTQKQCKLNISLT